MSDKIPFISTVFNSLNYIDTKQQLYCDFYRATILISGYPTHFWSLSHQLSNILMNM